MEGLYSEGQNLFQVWADEQHGLLYRSVYLAHLFDLWANVLTRPVKIKKKNPCEGAEGGLVPSTAPAISHDDPKLESPAPLTRKPLILPDRRRFFSIPP
jgi:hypothetical protein